MIAITEEVSNRIQCVRGACIIMVCMVHCISMTPYETVLAPFCHGAVGVFLFLSGLLTDGAQLDVRRFYRKRITRVFWPYLIWSVVYTLVYQDATEFLLKLLTGQCCGAFYFILVYMEMVLLTPLLLRLARSKVWLLGYLLMPVYLCVVYVAVWTGNQMNYPYNINHFLAWLSFYYLGLCIRNCESNWISRMRRRLRGRRMTFPIIWSALLVLCLLFEEVEGQYWTAYATSGMSSTQVKFSAMCTCFVACVLVYAYFSSAAVDRSIWRSVASHVLHFFGDLSFGIYLTHMLIITFLSRVIDWGACNVFLRWLLTVVLSAGFVWVLRKVCGKKIGRVLGV